MYICGMFIKWSIEVLQGYYFDNNGKLWKEPYTDIKGKHRDWRELKMQYPNRWKIGKKTWSKRQLRKHLTLLENPIEIYTTKILPF